MISVHSIYLIILVIIILDFVVERYFSYLNIKSLTPNIPKVLAQIYNPEEYTRMYNYYRRRDKHSMISSSVSFLVMVLFYSIGGFGWLDNYIRSFISSELVSGLVFMATLGIGSSIISFPFSYYSVFTIEQKFGFNKSTHKTFFMDLAKGALMGAVIGGLLYTLLYVVYSKTGSYFWLIGWGLISAFMLFMAKYYSSIIVPLFNKQSPLEEGVLRDTINEFSQKAGFQLDNIFVIDGSKRSTKANAYFTGLGSKKRIVLYDTLINDLEVEEIVAVLAHEIGHYKHKHTRKGMITSVIQTGVIFYLLSWFLKFPVFSYAMGAEVTSFYMSLMVFGLLFTPIEFILGFVMNIFSRKNEYQADAFAASYGLAEPLKSGLIKLSVNSLSNLTPHPLYVKVYYSHPTLLQRIEALNNIAIEK